MCPSAFTLATEAANISRQETRGGKYTRNIVQRTIETTTVQRQKKK